MFSKRFRYARGKTVAVADIGSGSAGVAILSVRPGEPARIIAAERCVLPFENRDTDATISGVLAQLSAAGEKALAGYRARVGQDAAPISKAYAIIRVPWTHSKTIRAGSQFPDDTLIEGEMVAGLARDALGKDTGFAQDRILEASIVRVELNGYPTAHPAGLRAHSINMGVLVSDCEPRIKSGVVEALSRTFSCAPPALRSGTRALLAVLREAATLPKNCLIVDMTSEATNFIALRKGVATEQALVPEGVRSILKRIATTALPEETLSLMRLLETDRCEEATCMALKASLGRAEPELVRVFGEAIGTIAAVRRLPNTLVLYVQEDFSSWLVQLFSRIDFAQFTMTTRPFAPHALTNKSLESLVAYTSDVHPDTGLCVGSALVNIEEGSA